MDAWQSSEKWKFVLYLFNGREGSYRTCSFFQLCSSRTLLIMSVPRNIASSAHIQTLEITNPPRNNKRWEWCNQYYQALILSLPYLYETKKTKNRFTSPLLYFSCYFLAASPAYALELEHRTRRTLKFYCIQSLQPLSRLLSFIGSR